MPDPTFATPKPRRRRFALSLRTLMLLVLVVSVLLGMKVRRASIQRRAVATIEEAGGEVTYDFEVDNDESSNPTRQPRAPGWLRRAVGDEYFQEVVKVVFDSSISKEKKSIEKILDDISALDRVEYLDLDEGTFAINGATFNGATLAKIAKMPRLKMLCLKIKATTDAGLACLSEMSALESLYLGLGEGTNTQKALIHIAKLERLKVLKLGLLRSIESKVMAPLAEMKQLEFLDIDNSPEDGACLAHLRGLTELRGLRLSSTIPSDSDLAHLTGMKRLESLSLDFVKITDAGLSHLSGRSRSHPAVTKSE